MRTREIGLVMLLSVGVSGCGADGDSASPGQGAVPAAPTSQSAAGAAADAEPVRFVRPKALPTRDRYQGYVMAAGKRIRTIGFGGMVEVRFRDRSRSGTKYKVCLKNDVRRTCVTRRLKGRARFQTFTFPGTPEFGRNVVRWYVGERQVERYAFKITQEQDGPDPSTAGSAGEDPNASGRAEQSCGQIGGEGNGLRYAVVVAGTTPCEVAIDVIADFSSQANPHGTAGGLACDRTTDGTTADNTFARITCSDPAHPDNGYVRGYYLGA